MMQKDQDSHDAEGSRFPIIRFGSHEMTLTAITPLAGHEAADYGSGEGPGEDRCRAIRERLGDVPPASQPRVPCRGSIVHMQLLVHLYEGEI
jgi:hypothetical protein